MPYGGKLLQKFLPNAMKSKVDEVTAFMDKKIAKVNGVTPQELATIRTAAKSNNVQKVTNKLDDLVTCSICSISYSTKKSSRKKIY